MRAFGILLCVVLAGGLPPASADYAETERRLKAAGVDPDLRTRIHKAIDRGVAFLLSAQRKRGDFRYDGHPVGVAALAGLALRHAGTPDAKQAAANALRFLVGSNGKGQPEVRARTYQAGLAAMLLMADRKHDKLAHTIARGLVVSQQPSGWWGYVVHGRDVSPGHDANLSTTQFAALGLWAAARQGAPVPSETWRRHLQSLVRTQSKTGSWSYHPSPSGPGYPNGTMMGAANFALAEQALTDAGRHDPAFQRKVLVARLRMLDAVRRDGQALLAGTTHITGHFDYYGLYAMEKACLFLGLAKLGTLHWYREGALALLKRQNADGGWGGTGRIRKGGNRSAPIATAFALLFLLRSSESYRPITPRPVDAPPVVTPPVVTESAPVKPPKK